MPNITPEAILKRKAEREARFPGTGKAMESDSPKKRLENLENHLFGPDYRPLREHESLVLDSEPAMIKPTSRAKKRGGRFHSQPPRL
ncbi:MAG TPA: hypothetical protein VN174_03130 [Candidatus Methanoperedens sp.]|nr:hypothetical protein [Candidatus Methanoperedens sp.]